MSLPLVTLGENSYTDINALLLILGCFGSSDVVVVLTYTVYNFFLKIAHSEDSLRKVN